LDWRKLVVPVLASVGLTCCGMGDSQPLESQDLPDAIREAIAAGDTCEELFELRNEPPPDQEILAEVGDQFRAIGCYSVSSERTG